MKTIISFCIAILMCAGVAAQNDATVEVLAGASAGISAICKKTEKGAIIRWAPKDERVWLQSLSGVVRVERLAFESFQKRDESQWVVLTDSLRPWTSAEIEQAMNAHPQKKGYIMAGALLHGEWESIDTTKQELTMSDIANRYDELINRYSSALMLADLDPEAASAMGLRFVDNAAPDANYISYRVMLFLPDGTYYQDAALYNKEMNMVATPNIDDAEALDGYVRLSWERKMHERFFTAYYIERSADGKRFERLNELPYVNAIDTKEAFGIPPITYLADAENGRPYHYRIIGLDAFGELSSPSPAVQLTAKDLTPPRPVERASAEVKADGRMRISWEQDAPSEDLAGYIVKKSARSEGPFAPVSERLPTAQRSFTDEAYDLLLPNFYQVCAIDEAGNEACSLPVYGFVNDSEPPAIPEGLSGHIDSAGVVWLSWPRGAERDLAGYHVYAANGPDQVFTRVNARLIRDTLYRDTIGLNTLTKQIYYRIAAVDVRSNVSAFSEMLRLEKPDTIPPTSTLFEAYEVRDSSIYLRWVNSNSRDVVRHELHRRETGGEWALLQTFTGNEMEFEDRAVMSATNYEYRISAVDDAGLRSRDVRTLALATRRQQAQQLPGLIAKAEGERVRLQFQLPEPYGEVARVVVYRSVNAGEFRHFSTLLDGYALELADSDCKPGNTYAYKYRIFYSNGLKSGYSAEQVLKL